MNALDNMLDDIEVDIGLSQVDIKSNKITTSTGLLTLDLMLSGGMVTGGWYTMFGGEQSCKSTLVATQMARAVDTQIPYIAYFDYEGSFDSNYFLSIARHVGVIPEGMPEDKALQKIFGLKDEKNNWVIQPRVRYYPMSIGEKFFDFVAKLERMLPDKLFKDGKWWLVYDDTKENKKKIKEEKIEFDQKLYKSSGKFWVETDNGQPQALIAVDSYPAMMPEKQDVDDPSNAIGMQARMFADNIKRIKGKMSAKRITIMGINQLRLKPMVSYGCFYYTSKVLLADGSTMDIGKIVNSKLPVEVMSYNQEKDTFEPKRVIDWFNNGNAQSGEFIRIKVLSGKNGLNDIKCTLGHKILDYKSKTFKPASEFKIGDDLVTYVEVPKFNSDQIQLIYGSILGDGSLRQLKNKVSIRFLHCSEQKDYLDWKFEMLSAVTSSGPKYNKANRSWYFDTKPLANKLLSKLAAQSNTRDTFKIKFSGIPEKLLNNLDLRGLAVWYQDDGTFYQSSYSRENGAYWNLNIACSRLTNSNRKLLADKILELTGVDFYVKDKGLYLYDKEKIKKFQNCVAPYMHKSFAYKCYSDVELLGSYDWNFEIKGMKTISIPARIVDISDFEPYSGMSKGKYDLKIEGNHTYIVNTCVVHNSPEYEPCGESLKFFSDVRIRMASRSVQGGTGQIEEEDGINGGTDQYRYIHMRAHKNKLSVPNLEGWARVWIRDAEGAAHGFDPVYDTFHFCRELGILSGTKNRLRFDLEKMKGHKPLSWLNFKKLILGDKATIKKVLMAHGVPKPFMLRNELFKLVELGKASEMFFAKKKMDVDGKASNSDDDDEDSDE